jgi:Holliday junction DNA helicase RuvA
MIGWLSGRVVDRLSSGALIVDVRGVGYEVHVADTSIRTDDVVELFILTVVRADVLQLYGFSKLADREFFELLIATQGVGPSTALGALRVMSVVELASAIEKEDVKKIRSIPGVGPKTASRIVLELKGKVDGASKGDDFTTSTHVDATIDDALRALGYSGSEIKRALSDVVLPDDEGSALRAALQLLHRL